MPHDPYKALYVHVPFCVSRCGYCDFETQAVPCDDPRIGRYIADISAQIREKEQEGELSEIASVYVGGGTPTHIGGKQLSALLNALAESVDAEHGDIEFTIEANPESFDGEIASIARSSGVNRISIGVQSFDDTMLQFLGRAHDAEKAREAIRIAKRVFPNVSIDLMCGIPGQTDEVLASSIAEAVELHVEHVSVYSLSIEPHTPFYKAVMKGYMDEPDEDVQAHQLELARDLLASEGYARYEVANYAHPGYESKHNSSYWTGVPYLGLGLGATTMTQNAERRMRVCNGQVVDDLDARQMAAEDMMLGMRMASGISDELVKHAEDLIGGVEEAFEALSADGLAIHEGGRWKPTDLGWLCGNELYGRILDLAP